MRGGGGGRGTVARQRQVERFGYYMTYIKWKQRQQKKRKKKKKK
jgi:hypothetical protein